MRDKLAKGVMLVTFLLLLGLCGWYINMEVRAKNADYIVRISFTGVENLFHDRYEYYSINGNKATNVSQYMKKFVDKEKLESIDIYKDEETKYLFLEVDYTPQDDENGYYNTRAVNNKYLSDWIDTKLGNQYRVMIDNWTNSTGAPDADNIAAANLAIQELGNHDIDEYYRTHEIGNISFLLIHNKDRYLIEFYDTLYEIKGNSLIEIMECPERGNFDYWYFTGYTGIK